MLKPFALVTAKARAKLRKSLQHSFWSGHSGPSPNIPDRVLSEEPQPTSGSDSDPLATSSNSVQRQDFSERQTQLQQISTVYEKAGMLPPEVLGRMLMQAGYRPEESSQLIGEEKNPLKTIPEVPPMGDNTERSKGALARLIRGLDWEHGYIKIGNDWMEIEEQWEEIEDPAEYTELPLRSPSQPLLRFDTKPGAQDDEQQAPETQPFQQSPAPPPVEVGGGGTGPDSGQRPWPATGEPVQVPGTEGNERPGQPQSKPSKQKVLHPSSGSLPMPSPNSPEGKAWAAKQAQKQAQQSDSSLPQKSPQDSPLSNRVPQWKSSGKAQDLKDMQILKDGLAQNSPQAQVTSVKVV